MSWQSFCATCGEWPVAFTTVKFCFGCWPGGSAVPPPCLECGSTTDYFTNGLCGRCHRMGHVTIDTCPDCFAWGASKHRAWRCTACNGWREKRKLGVCSCCSREVPINIYGACRLCTKQRTRVLATKPPLPLPDLIAANRNGQQLWFADMGKAASARRPKSPPPPVAVGTLARFPVTHLQLPLFRFERDLSVARRVGHLDPRDANLALLLDQHVDEFGRAHGWDRRKIVTVQHGVHILLGQQETIGAPIRCSDIDAIAKLKVSTVALSDALDAAGMLDDDRPPSIVGWFATKTNGLPETIAAELGVWFDVMRHGSTTPPRSKPRSDLTIGQQLRSAMPAVETWATTHTSLREVTRDDIYTALPASGWQRTHMLQGLRSIFRTLKGRKVVFTNPTTHIRQPHTNHPIPAPVGLATIRNLLDSPNTARALTAALLCYHAIRVKDLRHIGLTDIYDRRLHLGDQTIVLADAVLERLDTYLFHRHYTWPNTANEHLFINIRSAHHTRPVDSSWHTRLLGTPAQQIRQDRILDEAFATGGDLRQISDLFGLSVAQANIYANHAHHAALSDQAGHD